MSSAAVVIGALRVRLVPCYITDFICPGPFTCYVSSPKLHLPWPCITFINVAEEKGNEQELIQSHIPTSTPKGKEAHTHKQTDKHSQKTRTANRMKISFPNRWSPSASLTQNSSKINLCLFSILTLSLPKGRRQNFRL